METYIILSLLVIILLIKMNNDTLKKLKKYQHDSYNAQTLYEVNLNLSIEIERQKHINIAIAKNYNDIRNSVIDIPLKNGRFFYIKTEIDNKKYLCTFGEN